MNTRFNRAKLALNLPDAYSKEDSSNNAKILATEKSASDSLRAALGAIDESLDIDKAYGRTLDLYGEMVGQVRGTSTDEQYRVLIKGKLMRNFSSADYNSIVRAICMTFDCAPSEITLTEMDEPCKVKLEGVPIAQLLKNNIDVPTASQIVYNLLPVGVQMESLDFAGTFEFSGGTELVYDEEKGFADDAQTIGGYLGLTAGSADQSGGATDESTIAALGQAVLGQMILGQS